MAYKSYKDEYEGSIKLVEKKVNELIERSDRIKEEVSQYLPEEYRRFTWGVRRAMLFDQRYDKECFLKIKKRLNDLDNASEQIISLNRLRYEMMNLA